MVQPPNPGIKGPSEGAPDPERDDTWSPDREAIEPPATRHMELVREIGGPAGPEPTRYGDWERNGRCIDF